MSQTQQTPRSVGTALPPLTRGPHSRFLDRLVVIATLGGLLFGYDTGVINGALAPMSEPGQLGLTPLTQGMVTSSLLFGAAIGALIAGRCSDRWGRRRTIVGLAVLFFLGAVGCVAAPAAEIMIGFRFVLGLAVGGASVTVPVYLSEVAPTERRGALSGRNEVMIAVGQLLAFVINAIIGSAFYEVDGHWRIMLAVAALPALALFFGMVRMPESPRWLLARGDRAAALAVLERVRSPERARAELAEVEGLAAHDAAEHEGGLARLREPWVRRVLLIGIGVAVAQQLSGINSVMYYGTVLLEQAGFTSSAALIANVANGIMAVAGMLTGVYLVDRLGRRRLLIYGFIGITSMHLMIGLSALLLPEGTLRAVFVLIFVIAFVGCMQASIGFGAWIVLAEIFPLTFRGAGIGISVLMMWLANATVTLLFPSVVSATGITVTFFLFAGLGALCLFFFWRFVPETKGRSLEQIEESFAGGELKAMHTPQERAASRRAR